MDYVTFQDPLTRLEITGYRDKMTGDIHTTDPLGKTPITMKYNAIKDVFEIPARLFHKIEYNSIKQFATVLGVSIQRASKIVKDGKIDSYYLPDGRVVVKWDDILSYMESREERLSREGR